MVYFFHTVTLGIILHTFNTLSATDKDKYMIVVKIRLTNGGSSGGRSTQRTNP